jgi:hypothetical protein
MLEIPKVLYEKISRKRPDRKAKTNILLVLKITAATITKSSVNGKVMSVDSNNIEIAMSIIMVFI